MTTPAEQAARELVEKWVKTGYGISNLTKLITDALLTRERATRHPEGAMSDRPAFILEKEIKQLRERAEQAEHDYHEMRGKWCGEITKREEAERALAEIATDKNVPVRYFTVGSITYCVWGTSSMDYVETLRTQLAEARGTLHAAQEALEEINLIVDKWEAACPEDVFKPFTAVDHPNVSPDRIAAQMGRHIARELRKQIAALSPRPTA